MKHEILRDRFQLSSKRDLLHVQQWDCPLLVLLRLVFTSLVNFSKRFATIGVFFPHSLFFELPRSARASAEVRAAYVKLLAELLRPF